MFIKTFYLILLSGLFFFFINVKLNQEKLLDNCELLKYVHVLLKYDVFLLKREIPMSKDKRTKTYTMISKRLFIPAVLES